MTNVIDSLPEQFRDIIVEIVSKSDTILFSRLLENQAPNLAEREAVEEILADEFSRNLQPGYEPTERGALIDNALGAFLLKWPIERE